MVNDMSGTAKRVMRLVRHIHMGSQSVYFDRELAAYIVDSKPVTVHDLIEAMIAFNEHYTETQMVMAAQDMLDGDESLSTWVIIMAGHIRTIYTLNYLVGRGDDGFLTTDDAYLNNQINNALVKLSRFAQSVFDGQKTPAEIKAITRLFGVGALPIIWHGVTLAYGAAGYRYERRFLQPADHCRDCVGYAMRGVVPIGSLPEPGDASVCGNNCKCYKQFYHSIGEALNEPV